MKKLKTDDAVKIYGDAKCESFYSLSPRDSRSDAVAVLEKAAASKRDVLICVLKK